MSEQRKSGGYSSGGGIVRQSLILVFLAVVLGGLNGWLNPATPPWDPETLGAGEVNLATVDSWGSGVLWVDARSEGEFEDGHIPGAVLLNEDQFDELLLGLLEEWDGAMPLVVYCDCRQCGASGAVAGRLREDFAMEEVYVLKGGWREWKEASGR